MVKGTLGLEYALNEKEILKRNPEVGELPREYSTHVSTSLHLGKNKLDRKQLTNMVLSLPLTNLFFKSRNPYYPLRELKPLFVLLGKINYE